jgi:hypothetical protein
MACLWSTKAPPLEAFLPIEEDAAPPPSADNMTLKITSAMQTLGAKTSEAPVPAARTYSATDLEFIERVNNKLLGS